MITTAGKIYLKGFYAGINLSLVKSIGFGIGDSAANVADTILQFEVDRQPVSLIAPDYSGSKIVFKAPISNSMVGEIREVGLFTTATAGNSSAPSLLTTFDSATEQWITAGSAATFNSSPARIGVDSLFHAPIASATMSSTLSSIQLDLSSFSGADPFNFAYNVGNANTANVKFRFLTDVSNYYEFSLGAQTSGYKIIQALKSTATPTGTPDWSNITQIMATTISSASGPSAVNYDGLRVENLDIINPSSILLAHEVLSSPYVRTATKTQEIEYSIGIA